MPRDNEELGRFLETLSRNGRKNPCNGRRRQAPKRGRLSARLARFKDYVGLAAMLALLWGAHCLTRWATRLFLRGILPAKQTRVLLRWAARLNRTSLAILRRRQRRRLFTRYAGNDNHDHRA